MDEICLVIPGTNEIGAKLTRWIIITDYANLIVTAVVEEMNKWSIDLTYLLPCTLTSMNTVYFCDINIVACLTPRQCLKRGYISVICFRLGVYVYTDVCILHAQKIMSWYEVGGVMSIKRLNKLCDIRVGRDRR